MSKRIVNISSLLSFMLLLSGCGQETSLTPLPDIGEREPVEIHLNASLVQVSVEVTRAGTQFITGIDGMQVGLYGMRNSTDLPGNNPYINNWQFTASGSGALTSPTHAKVYFPAGREQAFLYAYSPYTESIVVTQEGHVRIPVKSGLVESAEAPWNNAATDPLYASDSPTIVRKPADSPDATASGTASFAFHHAMAKLNILVTTSSTVETYLLNGIAVTFTNGQYGYMDLTTGDIAPASDTQAAKVFTETYPAVSFDASTTAAQFSHSVIPPAKDTDNAIQKITVNVGGTEYIVYEAETGPAVTLTKGGQKTLRIKFNLNNTGTVSLNDWNANEDQEIESNHK